MNTSVGTATTRPGDVMFARRSSPSKQTQDDILKRCTAPNKKASVMSASNGLAQKDIRLHILIPRTKRGCNNKHSIYFTYIL